MLTISSNGGDCHPLFVNDEHSLHTIARDLVGMPRGPGERQSKVTAVIVVFILVNQVPHNLRTRCQGKTVAIRRNNNGVIFFKQSTKDTVSQYLNEL